MKLPRETPVMTLPNATLFPDAVAASDTPAGNATLKELIATLMMVKPF